MSTRNTADIDELIQELEHYRVNMNDRSLGTGFWDRAVKDFIGRKSGKIVSLLEEFAKTRGKTLVNPPTDHFHHVILEGRADGPPAKALSAALNKAFLYFSDQHDIILVLQKIMKLPEGVCSATMEVHILPPAPQNSPSSHKQNEELKHINDHNYGKKHKGQLVEYPVFNHFEGNDDGQADLPDYILVNVSDPDLMNYMIREKFFDAGGVTQLITSAGTPLPKQIMVRVRHPRLELAN